MMNKKFYAVLAVAISAALILFAVSYTPSGAIAQSPPPVTYGTLDNFDVINDTGGDCHGFEIELEGITSADVPYWFGAPYQRYGEPSIVPTSNGVIVRYAATYAAGAWSATTPIAGGYFPPTDGHSCWAGVNPNYLSWGCDHFGVSLNAAPTRTTYRWLVEGTTPGSLVQFGSNTPIPAPVWNVTPASTPGDPPAVATVIPPIAPVGNSQFGEPMWIKVWVTTLPNAVHAEDLNHMIIDDPDVNIVPNEPAEIEWEGMLLQAKVVDGVITGDRVFTQITPSGSDAVTRRFEFYKYTGLLDPDTENLGEALCDNPTALDQQLPASPRCGEPDANGVAGVGDLIGAQNVAVNLAGPVIVTPENHPPLANPDSAVTTEDVAILISPAFLLGNDSDADGDAISIQSVNNAISGTVSWDGTNVLFTPNPDFDGSASFDYTISDGPHVATASVSVTVTPVNDPPTADAGPDQSVRMGTVVTLNGGGSADVDGDNITFTWALTSVPAKSRATLSGGGTVVNPTFKADKAGTYLVSLVVNDGKANSVADTVTITATKGKK
ncbi:MAG: cadherin-like domain-containing protein [Acidobacteria bacterium]|nr:cadherin-like domain-containing protein [Acidobacteriota bacterium]